MGVPTPWLDEPDYEFFSHAGVECLVLRMPDTGCLNGYIALPDTHPWYGRELQAFQELNLEFSRAITFAQEKECSPGEKAYVIGFDTQSNSYWPKRPQPHQMPEQYYTFEQVQTLTQELALEASRAGKVRFKQPKPENQDWMYPWNFLQKR
jgi:hypothetical protein